MSTDQVLLGVGLILVLAVGSQVLASRLRIPALIILLPAGSVAMTCPGWSVCHGGRRGYWPGCGAAAASPSG